jgi:hypothetical protein
MVQIPLVASAATFEGSGPIAKIPGHIVQVTGNGARPAVGTGNRRNKRTERNRFHYQSTRYLVVGRLKGRGEEEPSPTSVHNRLGVYTTDWECTQQTGSVHNRLGCTQQTGGVHNRLGVYTTDWECTQQTGSVHNRLGVYTTDTLQYEVQ